MRYSNLSYALLLRLCAAGLAECVAHDDVYREPHHSPHSPSRSRLPTERSHLRERFLEEEEEEEETIGPGRGIARNQQRKEWKSVLK